MGSMTNIVALPRIQHHIHGIPEVQHPENISSDGTRDEKQIQFQMRIHRNGRKQNPGNATAGSYGRIPGLVLIQVERKYISQNDRPEIHRQKSGHTKRLQYNGPEEIERNHIEQQMHQICMEKTCRKEADVLFVPPDGAYVKFILLKQCVVIERHKTDDRRHRNYQY